MRIAERKILLALVIGVACAALRAADGGPLLETEPTFSSEIANSRVRAGSDRFSRPSRVAQFLAQSTTTPKSPESSTQRDKRPERTSLTSYPKFENVCINVAQGYDSHPGQGAKLFPVLKPFRGACGVDTKSKHLTFSVTHENDRNSHAGAANYNQNIVSYMGDFDPATDIGRWLDMKLIDRAAPPSILLALDTVDFHKTNVTGWPIQFGHMFIALNDGTVTSPLDKPANIELDIKIETKGIRPGASYSGRRVMVGAVANWDEAPPRTNKKHYLEVDLVQSEGYSASYNELLKPLCRDVPYDRCFYSDGPYAEGREVRYETVLGGSHVLDTTRGWLPIRIPLSDLFRRLKWASPPSDWSKAQVSGLYIGIESTGETSTQIELRNYEVYR